jgi:hypothetical protein
MVFAARRYLPTDDRAHAGLERVPRSGRVQSRTCAEQSRDRRVARKVAGGTLEVEVETCYPARSIDGVPAGSGHSPNIAYLVAVAVCCGAMTQSSATASQD